MSELDYRSGVPTISEAVTLLKARASSFRWLSEREPYRRTLTVEECHILAREAEAIAACLERGVEPTEG